MSKKQAKLPDELGVKIHKTYNLALGVRTCNLHLCEGSAADFKGDAIVNAANEGCLGGAGIDGVLNDKGGWEFIKERRALPEKGTGTRCSTGEAVITDAGALDVRHVIHAVGPIFFTFSPAKMKVCEEQLRSAYQNALKVAGEFNQTEKENSRTDCIQTIGFALLSCGTYRGRKTIEEVLGIGVEAIKDFFARKKKEDIELRKDLKGIFLIAFKEDELNGLLKVGAELFE